MKLPAALNSSIAARLNRRSACLDRSRFILGASIAALLATQSAQATTIYFDGASANWDDATKWSTASGATTPDPGAAPAIGDDVIFNITTVNGAETISLNGNQAANTLTFNNTTGSTIIQSTVADQTLTLASGITVNTGAAAVTIGSATAANRTNVILGTAGANQAWTLNGATSMTVTNGVAGTASSGNTQTLTLNGSSTVGVTFTGNTTAITDGVNGGKLALLVNGTATGSNNNFGVTLGSANSYTGGTTITQGRVNGVNVGAFGATNSLVTVQGGADNSAGGQAWLSVGGTWLYDFNISGFGNNEGGNNGQRYAMRINTGATIGASSNTFTIANAAAIGTSGTGSFTIDSRITGTGALTIREGGATGQTTTATFTNANNDYSGTTTLTRAILQLNASTAAQNSIIDTGAATTNVLKFGNGITAATIGGLAGTGAGATSLLNNVSGAVALTVGNNNKTGMSYSGNLSGASASVIKTGTGIQTLSGTNTYTGGTTINGGTLQFGKLVSMPASGAVAVTNSTLAVNLGGTGEWTTGTSGNGTVGGLLAGLGGQSGGTVTWSGAVNLGLDTTNGGTQTYSGTIADVGTSLGLTKLGTGTLVLSGPNSYTGATKISSGILNVATLANFNTNSSIGNGSASNTASDLVLDGGTLQYNGTAAASTDRKYTLTTNGGSFDASGTTAGTLTFSGDMTASGTTGSQTLTLTGSGTGATGGGTLSGTINNGTGSNVTALTKSGTGTWTLTGANTYTGGTTGNTGGTLNINNATAIGTGALVIGGTFTIDNTTASAITLTNNNALTLSGGSLTFTGTKDLSFGSGALTISVANRTITTTAGTLTVGAVTANAFKLTKAGAGTLLLSAAGGTWTGGAQVDAGTLKLGATNAITAGNGVIVSGQGSGNVGILDLAGFNQSVALLTLGGSTATSGATVTNSTGTSTLTNTGGITYSATGNPLGATISTTNLDLNGATQTFTVGDSSNAANDLTVSSVIQNGTLTKAGAGTLLLSVANTYTGGTNLNAGTLSVGNNTALGTNTVAFGGGTLANSTNVTLGNNFSTATSGIITSSGGTMVLNGNITGGQGLTLNPTNKITLAGTNNIATTATGTNTFYALVVNAGAGGVDITGSTTVGPGGSTDFNGGFAMAGTTAVTIQSGGSLTINGSGTTAATIPNSIVAQNVAGTSTLLVNGGTLTVGANTGFVLGNGNNNNVAAIAVLTISSGTATINRGTVGAANGTDTRLIEMGKDSTSATGTINLNGGTLATNRQFVRDGSSAGQQGTANFVFGGGTLKALGAQTDWLQSTTATSGGQGGGTVNASALALSSVTTTAVSTIDANSFSVAINSAISGVGGFNINSSTGTGTVTFGGANSYTGNTLVSNGTLQLAKQVSLYNNGAAATWSKTNINVASGATMAFNIGGTGEFTEANVNTILGLSDATNNGFNSGAKVGLDTTSGNVTYASAITNPNSGNNTLGLTKLGTNRLTLSNANTYTGPTNVTGGTLEVSGSITGTTSVSVTAGTLLLSNNVNNVVSSTPSLSVAGGKVELADAVDGKNQTFTSLTLSGTSTLDFGDGAAGNAFTFTAASTFASGTLAIWNWSPGTFPASGPDTGALGDGRDRLLFSAATGFGAQFGAITFYSDNGITPIGSGAAEINFGGQFEIVPVPEPSSTALLGAAGLVALVGYRERRRLLGLKRRQA